MGSDIHSSIASKFPEQTALKCERCGDAMLVSREQTGRFFAGGWPECHGATMTWLTKPEEVERVRQALRPSRGGR